MHRLLDRLRSPRESATRFAAAAITPLIVALLLASCSQQASREALFSRARKAFFAGDLTGAMAQISRPAARSIQDQTSPWFWKFRLLQAEVLLAQSKSKEAEALLSLPVPDRPELKQAEVRRLVDLAGLRTSRKVATELLNRASADVAEPELAIRIKLAQGVLSRRDPDGGQPALHDALDMAERQGMPYWQAYALSNLSSSSKLLNRHEEAVEFGLRSLTIAESAHAQRIAAFAHVQLGPAYSYLGAYESALQHEEQAVRMLEPIGDRAALMIGLGELGLIHDSHGDSQEALAAYQRAYRLAKSLGSNSEAARLSLNLATTLIKSEQWDAADEWNQRAYDLVPLMADKSSLPYLVRNKARIAYGRGQTEEAARICEDFLQSDKGDPNLRWAIHELLGIIYAGAKQYPQANQEFESALKLIDGAWYSITNPQNRITLLSRLIPFYQEYVDTLVRQDDDLAALRIVESSRARVLAGRLGRDVSAAPAPDLASLRRLAKTSNAALLSFWVGPSRSFAWLITAGNVCRFNLPSESEMEKLISNYRQIVEHSVYDPIASKKPAGSKLWTALMAEIAPRIPKGSRLIVIPDGPLHRLNLETLVVPLPSPHYWIEDVEIAVAPSLTLAASKRPTEFAPNPSLLLIGAPDYAGTEYLPLKTAASEIRDIESNFPNVTPAVFTGANATPGAYLKASPGQFRVIHFAAHAEANRENPLDSAVILSGHGNQYKLYARDVIDTPIQAGLVTISACHSAGIRAYAGEGLIGFAWAFLRAGARSVVAGLWDVSDQSTEPLMNRFYAGIAAGLPPVTAMRNAKLGLSKSDARYRKPFYWAPFQVYVGSAMAR